MPTELDDRLPPAIAAIMNALIETCGQEPNGDGFDPALAVSALASAVAVIMESSESIQTPRDIRLAGESVAKEFQAHFRGWRKIHELTGERAWYVALTAIRPDEPGLDAADAAASQILA